ncbi:MAG: hypothetical protein JW924_14220, partial [Fusobacteriaceae bacterium]|nr:hypothetical protein [Fusobacteriaceae bacterium]
QSEFFTQLVKTVLIIAIAIMYFTNPLLFAKAIDDISNDVTKTIISTADKKEIKNYLDAIADAKRQEEMADKVIITIIANDLWEEYIHKPWRIMEFGDNEIADQWQDRVLSEKKGSDERKEVIENLEQDTDIKTEAMVVERLGFMLMYFIPLIINILLMCLFCIFIIGVQFLIVFVFILGIFVFMLALIPSIGGEILKKWAATLGVLAGMKVVLAFVLMLMIAFNQAVFTAMSEDGWIYALLIQLVLYFAIYMYRGKIIGIFSSAREVIANPVESFKNLKRTGSTDPYRNRGNGGLLPRRNPRNVRGIGSVVSYLGKNRKEYKAAKNERQKLIEGKEKEHNEQVERKKARKHLNNKYKFFKKKRDAYFSGKSKNRVGKKGLQISNMVDKRIANKQEAFTDKEVDTIVSRRKNAKEYLQKRRMREGEYTIVKYTEPLPEIKEVKKKKGFKRFNPVNRRNRRRKD